MLAAQCFLNTYTSSTPAFPAFAKGCICCHVVRRALHMQWTPSVLSRIFGLEGKLGGLLAQSRKGVRVHPCQKSFDTLPEMQPSVK